MLKISLTFAISLLLAVIAVGQYQNLSPSLVANLFCIGVPLIGAVSTFHTAIGMYRAAQAGYTTAPRH